MTSRTDERLASELVFHDQQADARAATFAQRPDLLHFRDEAYLDHEDWIRPAIADLGDVRGLRVLDYGCGHGMAAVVLARRGGLVTAFDLSLGYLKEAKKRAIANRVAVDWVQANGERLPFADATFDRIWGNAVLHHLHLDLAARELRRVLRPGGIAVFCEPWGGNPLIRLARRRLHYPGKSRTPDEEPFRAKDLRVIGAHFDRVAWRGYQFLSGMKKVLGPGPLSSGLNRCDRWLLEHIPLLRHVCRYVVVTLK